MTRQEKRLRDEDMKIYKAAGHTMKEVAEKFGLAVGTAKVICRGIAPQKPSRETFTPSNKGILKEDRDVAQFIADRMPGVEYAGNYTGCDGRVDLKCKTCGLVFNRSMISVRKRHCSCPNCREIESNKRQEKRQKEKDEKDERDRLKRERRDLKRIESAQQIKINICAYCGKPFYSNGRHRVFCSSECSEHSYYKTQGSDGRLNKNNIVDRDITLKKLFDRDNGICQICGKPCDYSDYRYNENNIFIAGEDYPSKDHIVPLSLGGLHSWDNIRLAHRGCNSREYINKYVPPRPQTH